MSWTERQLDEKQTAMFDVVLDQIVPSMKAADREIPPTRVRKSKRCQFGRSHLWIFRPGTELCDCATCGAISYDAIYPERQD